MEFLARQLARSSFLEWVLACGFKPAKHHRLLISELQTITDKFITTWNTLGEDREQAYEGLRLMVLMPPGSAKSTYVSKLFPPWFLAQFQRIQAHDLGILACSHEAGLATDFGRAARNLVEGNQRWLGYTLKKDSRAADQWETSNGGFYKASSVGAGISGRRMHFGFIDDYVGKEEDVNSKTYNDKVENWYLNDFVPRLQPCAARVIVANHRNENDLVGRLLTKEPTKWRVIRLRLLIETEEQAADDPLGRSVGDYLWPEYFTRQQVLERMSNPSAHGIEQQEPAPVEGNFFKAEWFRTYEINELPSDESSRTYGASDHAVRTNQSNDSSCLGLGRFKNGTLYIHPDLVWDKIPTDRAVDEMIRMFKKHNPLWWWAEKENISGSIGPFLQRRMRDEQCWIAIQEVPHKNKDLMSRCQPIHALMSMGLVRFPVFAPWFARAKKEMMTFPNGRHDDFVSFMAHLGRGIAMMSSPIVEATPVEFNSRQPFRPTLSWLKESCKAKDKMRLLAMKDD